METTPQNDSQPRDRNRSTAIFGEYFCYVFAVVLVVFLTLKLTKLELSQKELVFGLLLVFVLGFQTIVIGGMFSLYLAIAAKLGKA